jgi:hypothetical protein
MPLTLLEPDAGRKHLNTLLGVDPSTAPGLAELLRAEVTARGMTPRAAALARVHRLIAPVSTIDPELLARTCDALVREGDLVLATGGMLAATPLRLVRLEGTARVSSSLPTHTLQVALGVEVDRRGLGRRVVGTEEYEAALAAFGVVFLSPAQWAGLDRALLADDAFLQRLDQRLQCAGSAYAGDAALEWRGWTWHEQRWTWRRDARTPLWRARCNWGGFVSAWSAGASPATTPCFELPPEDGARARFALARRDGHPVVVSVQAGLLTIPGWLPRAEYRWLSLHAEPALDAELGRWRVPAAELPRVLDMLRQRLGVLVEEA